LYKIATKFGSYGSGELRKNIFDTDFKDQEIWTESVMGYVGGFVSLRRTEYKSLTESGLLIYNLFKILYTERSPNADAYRYTR
jgi:hypothetical protein